jgi:hypothetical protein
MRRNMNQTSPQTIPEEHLTHELSGEGACALYLIPAAAVRLHPPWRLIHRIPGYTIGGYFVASYGQNGGEIIRFEGEVKAFGYTGLLPASRQVRCDHRVPLGDIEEFPGLLRLEKEPAWSVLANAGRRSRIEISFKPVFPSRIRFRKTICLVGTQQGRVKRWKIQLSGRFCPCVARISSKTDLMRHGLTIPGGAIRIGAAIFSPLTIRSYESLDIDMRGWTSQNHHNPAGSE